MLNYGKTICVLCDKKDKCSNSHVRKKNSERNKKP